MSATIPSYVSTGSNERFDVVGARNRFTFTGGNSNGAVFGADVIALSSAARTRGSFSNEVDFTGFDNNLTVSLGEGQVASENGDSLTWDPVKIGLSTVRLRTRAYGDTAVTGGTRGATIDVVAGGYSRNALTAGRGRFTVNLASADYTDNDVTGGRGRNMIDITAGQYSENTVTGGGGSNTIAITAGQYSDNTVTGGSGSNAISIRSGRYAHNHVSGGSRTNKFVIDGNDDQYAETTITGGSGRNVYTVKNAGNQQYSSVTIDSSSRKDVLNLSNIAYAGGMTASAVDSNGDGNADSLDIASRATGQQIILHNYFDNTTSDTSHLRAGAGYIAQINFSDRRKVALGDIVQQVGSTIDVLF